MKYIIDIPDGIKWGVVTCRTEDGFYTRDFDFLEELNSDYINEHYGSLQDDAYQRGLEDGKQTAIGAAELREKLEYQKGFKDGKAIHEKGCEGCKYECENKTKVPCILCSNNFKNQWTAKDDKIEVGDEVTHKSSPEKCGIVTKEWENVYYIMWADGSCGRWDKENIVKTGRHFDIASILEEMKHD